ncbi:MAG TPA: TolC family protein [Ignavibacteriaceae bacterium]
MKLFLASILLLISANSLFAQSELTLDQAIRIAIQKNSGLLTQENELASGESGVTAAYGNFLPTLGLNAGWGWNRNDQAERTAVVDGANIKFPAGYSESRNYYVGANSNVVLFDGLSNIANLSKSKNNVEAIKLSIEAKKQEVVFQTISLYYSITESYQLLKVREEDVKQQQKNLETITERNRLGSVTMADVYQQQVQLGNAELEVIRANNALETAKSNLLYYLGLDVLENYTYSKYLTDRELAILAQNIDTDYNRLNDLVKEALENRRDYQAQKLNLNSLYDNLTIARSGHLPSLVGNINFNAPANTVPEIFDSRNLNIGLNLNIPIFSGFSVDNAVQIAEVNVMNSEIELKDTERFIKQNLQKSFLDLEAAKKLLVVSEKNVKAAEENLKIEQEKYNLGAGKLLDVLIANTAFQNAKTNYINAQFFYIRTSDELQYNLGVLDYLKYE